MDEVTLSNQILLWFPESSDLYVVLHCHAEATSINGEHLKGVPLKKSHVPSLVTGWEENVGHYFLGNPHRIK
jgi:hypothetical protein